MTTPRARRRARTVPNAVAVAPFTVVIDTREQLPWTFSDIRADASQGTGNLVVPAVVSCLPAGDYSIHGYGARVAIERKSKADLFGTVGQGRDRFIRELERLNGYECAEVIVECEISEILTDPPRRTELSPKTITRSVIAWKRRYRNIHWNFLPGRPAAESWAYRVLERFWKDVIEVEAKANGAPAGYQSAEHQPAGRPEEGVS